MFSGASYPPSQPRTLKYDAIGPSQYGAMPEAGTAPPLRALAGVPDGATLSKSELHVVALDLSKAFVTCEYWSQAMSWKALGMPDEAIKILINMDAGSNSPADPHEGPGANTSVILDAGRMTPKCAHGRGVRQGSVRGPIKWVVFMHFWLTWIKSSMRGRGYTVAKANGMGVEGELLAQMFVDDSIWCGCDPASIQEILRRSDLFCEFHQFRVNRDKREYISLNDSGTQVRWTPSSAYPLGKVLNRKG